MTCTFFGHGDCFECDPLLLKEAIRALIEQERVDTFYVGHQGHFDSMVFHCLKELSPFYPFVSFFTVLAYFPTSERKNVADRDRDLYPEGLERCLPKFAIQRRNQWMIERSDCCLCYVQHEWGGAYRFARMAKKRGLRVFNLGKAEL